MDNYSGNKEYNIYRDIKNRTNGEIYLGIVGPVRTGKSTFIKRFMELMVLPFMEEEAQKVRAMDELPQAAAGKTIMTTEPKFIPQQAAEISLSDLKTGDRLCRFSGRRCGGIYGRKRKQNGKNPVVGSGNSICRGRVYRDRKSYQRSCNNRDRCHNGRHDRRADKGKLHKCRGKDDSVTEIDRKTICDSSKFCKTICAGNGKACLSHGRKISDNSCAGKL